MLERSVVLDGRNDGLGGAVELHAPKVVVVITCRNYAQFVGAAIESVAGQTYSNFRCVVVDDASSDDSRAVIETVLQRHADHRFSLLALDENVGQLRAFQLALDGTAGQFVAFLDADDYWFREFLELHVRAHLNGAKSAPISGSDVFIVDGENVVVEGTFSSLAKPRSKRNSFVGNLLPETICPSIEGERVVAEKGAPLRLIHIDRRHVFWHWVNTSAMVFRRDFIDIALPADGRPRERHADYYLAYLAQMIGGTLVLPNRLGVYRMHGRNLFANLPRIGGSQLTGVEPHGAVRQTRERIVLHVMRNWPLFEKLVGVEILVAGFRNILPWREIDALAKSNAIASDVRSAIARELKKLRLRDKHGVAWFAVKYLKL